MNRQIIEKTIKGNNPGFGKIWPVVIIIIAAVLSIAVYKCANIKSILNDDVNLISISAGLVTVITFVCNFLNSKASNSKEDYYLGRNLKLIRYYHYVSLKLFNYSPIRLLLWSVIVLAVIIESHRIEYVNVHLKRILEVIYAHDKMLRSTWAAVFIIVGFLGVLVLIGSVDLTKKIFICNETYSLSTENDAKRAVRKILKKRYNSFFGRCFTLWPSKRDDFPITYETKTGVLYEETKDNTLDRLGEFVEYYHIVYRCENMCVKSKVERIDHFKMFKCSFLKKLYNYYLGKWNWFMNHYGCELITPALLFYIANIDLKNQNDMLEKYQSDEKSLDLLWPWRESRNNTKHRTNESVDIISDMLNGSVANIGKDDDLNSHLVLKTLDCFRKLDSLVSKNSDVNLTYYSRFLDSLIVHVADSDASEKNIKRIRNNLLSYKYKEDVINRNMDIIFKFDGISTKKLEFLVEPFDQIRSITSLMFVLAYRKRSGISIISVDECKMWKRKLFCLNGYSRCTISEEDIHMIYNYISQSPISHFVNEKYISLVIRSLDKSIDDVIKEEFKDDIIIYQLDCYLILKLILRRNDFYSYLSVGDKERVRRGIHSIQKVLEAESVMHFFT